MGAKDSRGGGSEQGGSANARALSPTRHRIARTLVLPAFGRRSVGGALPNGQRRLLYSSYPKRLSTSSRPSSRAIAIAGRFTPLNVVVFTIV
jgi:hypothetical protein